MARGFAVQLVLDYADPLIVEWRRAVVVWGAREVQMRRRSHELVELVGGSRDRGLAR